MSRTLIHAIAADEVMSRLGANSKLNAERGYLLGLRDASRRHAQMWLEAQWDALGQRFTLDVRAAYL